MSAPLDSRRSEWTADLEEVADLAAEMAPPDEVPSARSRRRGWSAARLVALLAAGAAAAGEAAAAAAPAAGRRLPPRRRLVGTGLAVVGAAALCTALLLHHPAADPLPLSGGQAFSTPSPYAGAGGVALQPVPLDPTAPAALVTPAPLSSQAPRAAAVRPSTQGGAAPAPTPTVNLSPVIAAPVSQPAPSASSAPPTATAAPTAAPTAAASPAATPAGALTVQSVTLAMGTCQDQGGWWVCPETATFTFQPGAAGTLTFSIAGTDVGCTGAATAFDQPQKPVAIPQGTTRAVVTSALVFPASGHPAAAGPGGAPSTAAVKVSSPNRTGSASQPFGSASCP